MNVISNLMRRRKKFLFDAFMITQNCLFPDTKFRLAFSRRRINFALCQLYFRCNIGKFIETMYNNTVTRLSVKHPSLCFSIIVLVIPKFVHSNDIPMGWEMNLKFVPCPIIKKFTSYSRNFLKLKFTLMLISVRRLCETSENRIVGDVSRRKIKKDHPISLAGLTMLFITSL